MYWTNYSVQAHLGIVDMYVEDKRFKKYYDSHQLGLSQFFKEVIHQYFGA